jgi:DNA-binding transcriptional ArsR family regulator
MDSFAALADPTRRRILELLGSGERAAGAIAEDFALSPPAISQHLKVLREARLVHVTVQGQRRIYRLDREGWVEMEDWHRRVRRFWGDRLDTLERELHKPDPKPIAGADHESRRDDND